MSNLILAAWYDNAAILTGVIYGSIFAALAIFGYARNIYYKRTARNQTN